LREAEIKLAGGKTTGEVCRELGISEQSYYRYPETSRTASVRTLGCRNCWPSRPWIRRFSRKR